MKLSVFKGDLQITSREKALEFHKSVKCVHLIPAGVFRDGDRSVRIFIRVEPGYYISRVTSDDLDRGIAWLFLLFTILMGISLIVGASI